MIPYWCRQRFGLHVRKMRAFTNLLTVLKKEITDTSCRLVVAYDAGRAVQHKGWTHAPSLGA
jgi:hypothetical protein